MVKGRSVENREAQGATPPVPPYFRHCFPLHSKGRRDKGGMGEYREALKLAYFLGYSIQGVDRIPVAVGDANPKNLLQIGSGDFSFSGTVGII